MAKHDHDHNHDGSIWIRTTPTLDGKSYYVVMEVDADHSVHLEKDKALEYAMEVLTVVQYAKTDGAILKQLRSLLPDAGDAVAQAITDMRKDRPETDFSICHPFSLTPGVTQAGKAFIHVLMNEEPVGQWEPEDAEEHALGVLHAVITADLDGAYLRFLKSTIELEENTALATVADLANWR